jgi:hypothetical protein
MLRAGVVLLCSIRGRGHHRWSPAVADTDGSRRGGDVRTRPPSRSLHLSFIFFTH